MANNKYQWNDKAGTGWMKGKDGKWYQYKNHKKTGVSKNNLTLGSGAAKFISKKVKNLQSNLTTKSETRKKSMIGKGTEKNPEFTTNKRGRRVKNPKFQPTTMVAKDDGSKKVNKGGGDKKGNNKPNPWSIENVSRALGSEVARSKAGPGYVSTKDKTSSNTNKVKISTEKEKPTEKKKVEPLKTNVFTRHYKTGKELGVMTRSERRRYEKEAGQRTWESEKERLGATGNKQDTKASSDKWRRRRELELAKQGGDKSKKSDINRNKEKKFNANNTITKKRKKINVFSTGPNKYNVG